MGNGESISAADKAQAEASAQSCDWYPLLDLHGDGKSRMTFGKPLNLHCDRLCSNNINNY